MNRPPIDNCLFLHRSPVSKKTTVFFVSSVLRKGEIRFLEFSHCWDCIKIRLGQFPHCWGKTKIGFWRFLTAENRTKLVWGDFLSAEEGQKLVFGRILSAEAGRKSVWGGFLTADTGGGWAYRSSTFCSNFENSSLICSGFDRLNRHKYLLNRQSFIPDWEWAHHTPVKKFPIGNEFAELVGKQ